MKAKEKAVSRVPDATCISFEYEGKKYRVRPAYIMFTQHDPYPRTPQWWLWAFDLAQAEHRFFAVAHIKGWSR